ncbi:unnamed protein product, partial [Discosporangium mesarthrocarpum]
QESQGDWEDFTLCSVSVESTKADVLVIDAHVFNDIIYPGADLHYNMERMRIILAMPPVARTTKDIAYMARNVLSHHVAFQQMPNITCELIASRLTERSVSAGEIVVERGTKVRGIIVLLTGSASIIAIAKARKVGTTRGAEREALTAKVEEVLRRPPEERSRRDKQLLVNKMNEEGSPLDVARFRRLPACLKLRLAAAMRMQAFPPFEELSRDMIGRDTTYFFVLSGSVSLHVMPRAQRFVMETIKFLETASVKALDVDNALALEDWRASSIGPCVSVLVTSQILGEFSNSEQALTEVRAVTRQESILATIDTDLYVRQLDEIDPENTLAKVCQEVHAQLDLNPDMDGGLSRIDTELLLRLLSTNRVLCDLPVCCRLRLCSTLELYRFSTGEVVTTAQNYGDSLHIILHGRLEYAVQDSHRGKVDRSLIEEAGLTSGLKCVGIMTAGDYIVPDSMLHVLSGKRYRHLREGSYRIRCSPDYPSGASCLVLSKDKLKAAIQR